MEGFEEKLYSYRWWILSIMTFASLITAARNIDDLKDFFIVIGLHAFFGQAVYCYVTGRTMFLGLGAVAENAPIIERRVMAVMALIFFMAVFFY